MKDPKRMSIEELKAAKTDIAQKMAEFNDQMQELEDELQARVSESHAVEAYERITGQPATQGVRDALLKAQPAEAAPESGGGN